MDKDIAIGTVVLALSLVSLVALALWCRAIIEGIAAKGERSAREIMRDRESE